MGCHGNTGCKTEVFTEQFVATYNKKPGQYTEININSYEIPNIHPNYKMHIKDEMLRDSIVETK